MIQDHTIDQTLIELVRTMKALKALRAARRDKKQVPPVYQDLMESAVRREHAAATRASMDLTRKLADLRQGR